MITTMGPKKREKQKEVEWLECSLCKRWLLSSDAELHSKSCESNHPFIFQYHLTGRTVKAEDLKDESNGPVTKSVYDKDNKIWLAIPTMNICGFSIGQNVIINGLTMKKAWPMKGLHPSYIGLTKVAREEMSLEVDSPVTVMKFFWEDKVIHSMTLRLKDSNKIFEKEEFGNFLSSHLDGSFVTEGSPLTIKYFGQVCHCVVKNTDIIIRNSYTNTLDPVPANLSAIVSDTPSEDPTANSNSFLDSSQSPSTVITTPGKYCSDKSTESDCSDLLNVSNMVESFNDLDISNVSSVNSSMQETPVRMKFPNLVTPLKSGEDELILHKPFGKIISGFTKIRVESSSVIISKVKKTVKSEISLDDIGGLSHQINELTQRIFQGLLPSSQNKCILIHGPPGVGKSMFVQAAMSSLNLHSVYIAGTDIWSKLFGEAEANLRKIFTSAQERSPAVIIFDDLHVLCPLRSQNISGQQEHRIIGTLLSLIDKINGNMETSASQVVVIGITNQAEAIDPALRRAGRFGCEVEIGVPNAIQRTEILSIILNKISHNLTSDEIEMVAHNAHGYVGADLVALVNEAVTQGLSQINITNPPTELPSISVTLDNLVQAGRLIKPSALREIQLEVPEVRWTDIGGMGEVKMRLREAIEIPLTHPELYTNLGIEPPKGLLMYGPPGCSKTMVAKAVATECHLNFLAVKGPELFDQYVGESEKNIRRIFTKAKSAAPSVIFFDEIDAIASIRGSSSGGSSGVDDRVLTQLLTEMDGLENLKDVFIMAATNRPDKIDRALLRPGRFDNLVYVPLPDDETRKEILQNKLKKMGVSDDVNVDTLVNATQDFSGAEIIQMCQEAALCGLRQDINTRILEPRHFEEALKKVVPQTDLELIKIYQKFSKR